MITGLKQSKLALIVGLSALALSVAWLLWQYFSAAQLQKQGADQLQQIALQRAQALSQYYQNQSLAIQNWSQNQMDSLRFTQLQTAALKAAALVKSKVEPGVIVSSLRDYYINSFATRFREATGTSAGAPQNQVERLNELGQALQYLAFVQAATAPSDYAVITNTLSGSLDEVVSRQGWSDVIVVGADSGQVLFSRAKGIELGSVLVEGPMARTVLGELFQNALASKTVLLSDMDRHIPAMGQEVFFFAQPVLRDQKVVAVVIVQLPALQVQSLVSANQSWASLGLGQTGDIQLIGSDHAPRNKSRLMTNDPGTTLDALRSVVTEATVAAMKVTGSEALLRRIETEGSKAALSQDTWIGRYDNYLRRSVTGAVAKVDALGQRYGVLCEQEQLEIVPPSFARKKLGPLLLMFLTLVTFAWAVFVQRKRRKSEESTDQREPNAAGNAVLAKPVSLEQTLPIAEPADVAQQPAWEDHTVLVPIAPALKTQHIPSSLFRASSPVSDASPVDQLLSASSRSGKLIETCSRETKLQQTQWAELLRTIDILEALVARSASLALNATLTANAPSSLHNNEMRQISLMTDELRRLSLSARECVEQASLLASTQFDASSALVALNQQLQTHWQHQHELAQQVEQLNQIDAA
jgi:hypothetical protein